MSLFKYLTLNEGFGEGGIFGEDTPNLKQFIRDELGVNTNNIVFQLLWPHVILVIFFAVIFSLFAYFLNCFTKPCRRRKAWTWIGIGGILTRRFPLYLRATLWYLTIFAGIPAALVCTNSVGRTLGYFSLRMDKMTLFLFIYYVYKIGALTWANYPYDRPARHDPKVMNKIGVLIPCHKSADEIERTLRSILQNDIPPYNIVVADNANSPQPPDNTGDVVRSVHPEIQYIFVQQGLKTRAFWEALHLLPDEVEYIIHIDDDTIFAPNMHFDISVFEKDSDVSGVSFAIAMFHDNYVEKLVDFEFKQISQWRYWRSCSSTVWFCHGIIGFWRRDRFELMLEQHPFLPFGEDNWIGSMNMLSGFRMQCDLRNVVQTFSPPNLIPMPCGGAFAREQGYGAANVFKQRAKRWYVNAPRRIIWRVWMYMTYSTGSLLGDFVYRIEMTQHLVGIFITLGFPLIVVRAYMDNQLGDLFRFKGYYYLINLFTGAYLNYWLWGHRRDLQVGLSTILLYPFYKMFLHACGVYGHWRCLFYYIPWFPFNTGFFTTNPNLGRRQGILKGAVVSKFPRKDYTKNLPKNPQPKRPHRIMVADDATEISRSRTPVGPPKSANYWQSWRKQKVKQGVLLRNVDEQN